GEPLINDLFPCALTIEVEHGSIFSQALTAVARHRIRVIQMPIHRKAALASRVHTEYGGLSAIKPHPDIPLFRDAGDAAELAVCHTRASKRCGELHAIPNGKRPVRFPIDGHTLESSGVICEGGPIASRHRQAIVFGVHSSDAGITTGRELMTMTMAT